MSLHYRQPRARVSEITPTSGSATTLPLLKILVFRRRFEVIDNHDLHGCFGANDLEAKLLLDCGVRLGGVSRSVRDAEGLTGQ